MTKSKTLKLAVGYQLPDRYSISEVVETYRDAVNEVYFPFFGVPDGRGISISSLSDQKQMERELRHLAGLGIRMNLLLNANCYGKNSVSKKMEVQVMEAVRFLKEEVNLSSITTTSLFAARICKNKFPEIDVRASVNMEIGSLEGILYLADYFDSFYVARRLNRSPAKIKQLLRAGKPLYLLANSGCLKNCSAHTFHDNLVSHENEMYQQDNSWYNFKGVCWEFYAKKENRNKFRTCSTWLRPEEIEQYEGIISGIKLATRTNQNFGTIVKAYATRFFSGNILSLCEPDFSAFGYVSASKKKVGFNQNKLYRLKTKHDSGSISPSFE